jgi:autotransporter-associated beta strand protein
MRTTAGKPFRFLPNLMNLNHPLRPCLWAALLSVFHPASAQSSADWTKLTGVTPNPNTPGDFIIHSAPAALKVAAKVVIPHDLFSVTSFTVEDGAAATDLLLANGITEVGGACGFVKNGRGTLSVDGEVKLGGFITVYDGTLDFSKASLAPGVRVNLLGNSKLIPPASGTPISEIHINDTKLKPGLWGPPGSKAANESPMLGGLAKLPDSGPSRREIWQNLKYGIFSHYVWNGYGMNALQPNEDGTRAQTIDEMAEIFDVENYVNQLLEAEAQYVVFTAWHSGTCPLFPSAAMEKWAPDRPSCPKHDLLGRVLDACRAKGIRTFFYCHPYQPVANPHNDWINDLFAELVDRYSSRLDGIWIDENFQDCTQDKLVDYRRLMKTIKERNPDLVLTHNNGGYQSYGVDEGVQEVQWEYHEGRMASTYQIFNQTAKSPEDMLITTVIQAAANTMGGGIQWSIDAHGPGKNSRGGLDPSARPILDGFVKLFKPIAESVKNTRPSNSYPPPFSGAVVKLSTLSWGVATQSANGLKEFLHVLKAPAGNSLTLPPPADGKVFTKARLLAGGHAVSLSQSKRGITLTLPTGVSWQKPNTVIVMDVLAPGGVGLINNTSRAVNYLGNSWTYQQNGKTGEFSNDSHRTTADGDSFSFTFDGTDIAWISSRGADRGLVEIAIDGVSHGSVDLSKGSGNFLTVFSKSGLTRGKHILTGTKRGGVLMTVDAFQVSELINDHDSDVAFPATTRYGATAAALTGNWEPRAASWINGQSFSFTFHGTGVEILGGAAHGSGDLAITIDGQAHSTVSCNVDPATRSLAKITGLSEKEHTVLGQYTNPHPAGFISALDGFIVTRPDFWKSQKNRGLGELNDDAHVSEIKGSTGSYTFNGSGVEIYTTKDHESRTAHYTLEGGGSSLWVGLNHYSPVTLPGCNVFRYPNLQPNTYTVGFTNAANPKGANFSFVRLNIDALRVYKGESSSATPLVWGESGRGGSGTWDASRSLNWHDGVSTSAWLDLGALDHAAIFGGKPGTVTLGNAVNANHLSFRQDGYTLQGGTLTLTGIKPAISTADGVVARLACAIASNNGLTKLGDGTLTLAGTNLISGDINVTAGTLVLSASSTLSGGNLAVSDGALCQVENPDGAIADSAHLMLGGNSKLYLSAGVTEKIAALSIHGVVQPAGQYSAATHPDIIRGAGVLAVGGP